MGDAMIIHVVKQGETLSSIAEFYGKSLERLILENGITDTYNLAVGETLVILYPEIEYTIEEGDTLESIARSHNVSIMELLRNNPYLSDRPYIYPGEVIVIKYMVQRIRSISTNGFVYPFVNIDILKKTLPFLTYLTVFSYYYTNQGEIFNINDTEIIQISKSYGVAPIMMLSGYSVSQEEESEVVHSILINEEAQDLLINNLIIILASKGYYGVNYKIPYIAPEDRPLFAEFLEKLSTRLHASGFAFFISLTMNVFELLSNIKYEGMRFDGLGQSVDNILLITYEYGYTFGIPPTVVAFETYNNVFEFETSILPPEKLVTGLSTIGYIWRLPYSEIDARGQSMSYNSAIALAREVGAVIQFDEVSKSSYFLFASQNEYLVRFRDARGVNAILSLIPNHDLNGAAIWNIMFFFNQLWLLVNSQFEIDKVIPANNLQNSFL